MDLLTRKFSAAEVTELTGVTKYNLQSYLTRGHILGSKGKVDGGNVQGIRRSFSFFAVMEIALARALIDLGMTASAAFQQVRQLAHTDGSSTGYPGRFLGLPHHYIRGETILAVSGEDSFVGFWSHDDGQFFNQLLSGIGGGQGSFSVEGAVFVNVSQVFRQVCNCLGLDDRNVLDDAYAEHGPDHGANTTPPSVLSD